MSSATVTLWPHQKTLVVDLGFEPSRCSPSSHSPEFISLRRTPVLSTIGLGGENRTPTYGFGDRGSAIKLHRDTGADNQIRTDDLNVGNVSHYHCAIPATLLNF